MTHPSNYMPIDYMAWVFFAIAGIMFLLALCIRWQRAIRADRGSIAIGGDSSGINVVGEVKGDVTQKQSNGHYLRNQVAWKQPFWERTLFVGAAISGILSAIAGIISLLS